MPQSNDPIIAFETAVDESPDMPGRMRRALALTVEDGPLAMRTLGREAVDLLLRERPSGAAVADDA